MRALVQRVSQARVVVKDQVVGEIRMGLCCLVGVTHTDDRGTALKLANKLWHLRVFPDDDGKMNRSAAETNGELLIVSQFTLYGDTRRGRRPSYKAAADPDAAAELINELVAELKRLGASVETGIFGAQMTLHLTNSGPVTLMLEI